MTGNRQPYKNYKWELLGDLVQVEPVPPYPPNSQTNQKFGKSRVVNLALLHQASCCAVGQVTRGLLKCQKPRRRRNDFKRPLQEDSFVVSGVDRAVSV